MAKHKGKVENLKLDLSPEEARERGRAGGKKSGEARRKKRDAKGAIRLMLEMPAIGNIKENLAKLGVTEEDQTNMMAMVIRMFQKVINEADANAWRLLMEYGGYNVDQELKDKERLARIEAIKKSEGATSITSGDWGEDGDGGDVVIYMPEIETEEEAQAKEEES